MYRLDAIMLGMVTARGTAKCTRTERAHERYTTVRGEAALTV